MFEGFLHEALANSLGRILDISREQLRISLWSGESKGAGAFSVSHFAAAAAAAAATAACKNDFISLCCSLAHRTYAGKCESAAGRLRAPAAAHHTAERPDRAHPGPGALEISGSHLSCNASVMLAC